MKTRSGFQTPEQLEADRAAARIENMAHLTDADLTVRALRFELDRPAGGHCYASEGANHYQAEIQRRQAAKN